MDPTDFMTLPLPVAPGAGIKIPVSPEVSGELRKIHADMQNREGPQDVQPLQQTQYENLSAAQRTFGDISNLLIEMSALTGTVPGTTQTPESILADDIGKLQMQERMQGLSAAAGMSADMNLDIQAALLRDIRKTIQERDAVAKGLQADKAVSLWDNPIDALVNAFTIPWDEQKLEGINTTLAGQVKSVNDLSNTLTAAHAAAEATRQKTTQAALLSRNTALKGMVDAAQKELLVKAGQNDLAGIQFVMHANDAQMTRAWQYHDALFKEENAAFSRQQRIMLMEQKQREFELKNRTAAAEEENLRLYNLAADKLGKPRLGSVAAMQTKEMVGEGKKIIQQMILTGASLDYNRPTATLGDNVKETLTKMDMLSFRPVGRDQEFLVGLMQKAQSDSEATVPKKGEQQVLKAEEYRNAALKNMETVKFGDDSNPFRAPAFKNLFDRDGYTGTTRKLVNEILIPTFGRESAQSAHPELVAAAVNKAIREGKITSTEAAGALANFYRAGVMLNNVNNDTVFITGKKQDTIVAMLPTSLSPGQTLGGIAGAGAGAVGIAMGHPVIGGTVIAGGLALSAAGALGKHAMRVDATDAVSWRSYLVRVQTGFASKD